MTLTIDDELCQAALCEAIVKGDGPRVAELSFELVSKDRDVLVRKACQQCVAHCLPEHCRALIDFFVAKHKRTPEDRAVLADLIATVMAGVRKGKIAPEPTGPCRASVDALLGDVPTRSDANRLDSECLGKLPARLGKAWTGVVALAREAVRRRCVQVHMVHNRKLSTLLGGSERVTGEQASKEAEQNDVEELKLCALWTYTRDRAPPPPPMVAFEPVEDAKVVTCASLANPVSEPRIRCHLSSRDGCADVHDSVPIQH